MSLSSLSDHDLLLSGRSTIVAANRAFAQRLAHLVEFYRRRARDEKSRLANDPHFALTARQETVVEIGELWALSESQLRTWLNNALYLVDRLPLVWAIVVAGQLDDYRTRLVVEGARQSSLHDEAIPRYDAEMAAFLRRRLCGVEGHPHEPEIVGCTSRQLSNRINYLRTKLRPADAEERFRKAHAGRAVHTREDTEGMGWLSVNSTIDKVQVAHKRLTLQAKAARAAGDTRTLDQLRSDLAMDLIAGKTEGMTVPSYARPVVCVTVPVQTVMGLSDDPGMLSGGTVIPAGLARMIAADPTSTWYRMLTDPAGQMVELSTTSYQPTDSIWRQVVAEQGSCYRSSCDAPSTTCEIDHKLRWPKGATKPANLGPACKLDHKAKHSEGFGLEQLPDGSWCLLTKAGFRHPIPTYIQPTADGFPEIPLEDQDFQISASELAEAIAYLRHRYDNTYQLEDLWEDDPYHQGLPPEVRQMLRELHAA